MQVDGAVRLAGGLHQHLDVAGRVRVELRAAARGGGAELERLAQPGPPVRAGESGEQPRHGHGLEFGESAQGLPGGEDGLQPAQPARSADPDVGALSGGAVAE